MSAFFCNKTIFPNAEDRLIIDVAIGSQPAVTGVYIDGELQGQHKGDIEELSLGNGENLRGKKIRIHTAVQDKNENTDQIFVSHELEYGGEKPFHREVNVTAADEGDMFDVYTDISVY